MPVPSPRSKLLPARGNYSDLAAGIADILDGEICYAIDQDQYYQKEGSVLVSVGATKAQGLLAESALQDAPADGSEYVRKNGSWAVSTGGGGGGATTIDELSDVDTSSVAPTDGQALVWNDTDGEWQPGTVAGGTAGVTSIIAGTGISVDQATGDVTITATGGGGGGPATTDDLAEGTTNKYFPEAPNDGQAYVRQDEAWAVAPTAAAGSTTWTLTANGTSSYLFAGPGFLSPTPNPEIALVRGQSYVFSNTTGAHPFQIQSEAGIGGAAYDDGVTNNNVIGDVSFTVPFTAPEELYYQCTVHASMGGTIKIMPVEAGSSTGGVGEAPLDSKQYARQDGAWTEVAASGLEEAPNDDVIYARQNESWIGIGNIGTSTTNGRLASKPVLTMAGTQTGPYADDAAAIADGWTVPTLYGGTNVGGAATFDALQSIAYLYLPTSFNNVTWYGKSDPDLDPTSGQRLGFAPGCIMGFIDWGTMKGGSAMQHFPAPATSIEKDSTVNWDLLFAFWLAQGVALSRVYTREVTEGNVNYFVVRTQYADVFASLSTEEGAWAENGFYPTLPDFPPEPISAYSYDGPPFDTPEVSAADLDFYTSSSGYGYDIPNVPESIVTNELWLGDDGSVRMLYGESGLVVAPLPANDPTQYRYSGIYADGDPVPSLESTDGRFDTLPTIPLIGDLLQTQDGANASVLPVFEWGFAEAPAPERTVGLSTNDLLDVKTSGPANGDIMAYDSSKSAFVNISKSDYELVGTTATIPASDIITAESFDTGGRVNSTWNGVNGPSLGIGPGSLTYGDTETEPSANNYKGTFPGAGKGACPFYIEFWWKSDGSMLGTYQQDGQLIWGLTDSSQLGDTSGHDRFCITYAQNNVWTSGDTDWVSGATDPNSIVLTNFYGEGGANYMVGTKGVQISDDSWHQIVIMQEPSLDFDGTSSGIFSCFVDGKLVDRQFGPFFLNDPVDFSSFDGFVSGRTQGNKFILLGEIDNLVVYLGDKPGRENFPYPGQQTFLPINYGTVTETRTFDDPSGPFDDMPGMRLVKTFNTLGEEFDFGFPQEANQQLYDGQRPGDCIARTNGLDLEELAIYLDYNPTSETGGWHKIQLTPINQA